MNEIILDTLIKYGQEFQTKCVVAFLNDRAFVEQACDIVKPVYFESDANRWIIEKIFWYFNEYKALPTVLVLKREADKIIHNDLLNISAIEQLKNVFMVQKANPDDLKYVQSELLTFCKNQAIKQAVLKSADLLSTGNYDQIKSIIDKAIHAGADHQVGHIWDENLEERVTQVNRNVVNTPWDCVNKLLDGGLGAGELGCVVAPSGCHSKGTEILMHNGYVKTVEDIIEGDVVMGPDGTGRNVKNILRGFEQMYEIIPTKGLPFTVNASHTISLRHCKTNKVIDITVDEYLTKSNNFKNMYKLYRSSALPFSTKNLSIDPYSMGMLLGDGCLKNKNLSITTMDEELVTATHDLANQFNLSISTFNKTGSKASAYSLSGKKGHLNPLTHELRNLQLMETGGHTKFIPSEYKFSNIQQRLELLAGLIDTDGSLANNTFDISFASEQLLDDTIFIARSLGFAAYKTTRVIKGFVQYRTCISGNLHIIPTRLTRKKATIRKQIKNVLHTGFSIHKKNENDYYGFSLDGDARYLTADFTVHHNCGKSWLLTAIGAAAMLAGKTVAHYTFELSQTYVGLRYDTIFTKIESNKVRDNVELVKDVIKNIPGKLFIKYFPTRTVTVNAIAAHIQQLIRLGHPPDLVIIDYADLMRSVDKANARHEELGFIYEEIRGMAGELQVPIWTASQSQRSSLQDDIVEMDKIAGAYGKVMVCDFIMSASRKAGDKITNTARIHIPKNRFGPDGMTYPAEMDLAHGAINIWDENSPQGAVIKAKLQSGEGMLKQLMAKKLIDVKKTKVETEVDPDVI